MHRGVEVHRGWQSVQHMLCQVNLAFAACVLRVLERMSWYFEQQAEFMQHTLCQVNLAFAACVLRVLERMSWHFEQQPEFM